MSRSKQENETQGNAACDADVYGHKAFSITADVRAFVRARADGEIVLSFSLEKRGERKKETEIGLTKRLRLHERDAPSGGGAYPLWRFRLSKPIGSLAPSCADRVASRARRERLAD